MNPFTPYLAAVHLQELLDDAANDRRARIASRGERTIPAWRRTIGGALVSAARVADPCVELRNAARRSTDGRAFAS